MPFRRLLSELLAVRVAWIARVAAQRFGTTGSWCTTTNDKVNIDSAVDHLFLFQQDNFAVTAKHFEWRLKEDVTLNLTQGTLTHALAPVRPGWATP